MRKGLLVALLLALGLALVAAGGCVEKARSEGTPAGTPWIVLPSPTPSGGAEGASLLSIPYVYSSAQQTGIWVNGTGKVTLTPDVAILSLGVEARGGTVEKARSEAARAMEAVMTALLANGVKKEDIKTQWFSIQPEERWTDGFYIILGYRVSNMVMAKIREVEKAGIIIDAVAAAGGDLTRLQAVSFTVDNPEQYDAEARARAMADAHSKAEQLARLAGVTLGPPSYITESGGFVPYYPVRMYGAEVKALPEPATPISPGETEVTMSVQVVYTIIAQ